VTVPDLVVVVLHPHLSQPQGDQGNALALVHRARHHGAAATVVRDRRPPGPAPTVYLLGGLSTMDQPELASLLRADDEFLEAVAGGAPVLAVGSGYEVVVNEFVDVDGHVHEGVGLLDATATRSSLVEGPVVTRPAAAFGLPAMSGFESHTGRVHRGTSAGLAELELGTGNTADDPTDGAVAGHVVGTYLHGPVLARNPELADLLLGWALGTALHAPADPGAEQLRAQRIAEDRADPTGWAGRRYGRTGLGLRRRRSA